MSFTVYSVGSLVLTDEHGQPMSPRVERVLLGLVPKLQTQFPSIRDDVTVVEILEEAGRKIIRREGRGAIERLHAYAWVAVRSGATSHLRRGSGRFERRVVTSNEAEIAIDFSPTLHGGQADIERAILLRELLGRLRPRDRVICHWKIQGLSSQEIAARRGSTVAAVEKALSRALASLRVFAMEGPNAKKLTPCRAVRFERRMAFG